MGTEDDMRTETLADVMRRLRGDTKLKQKAFGERVGLSLAMVGHVESGRRSLSVESLEKIARALKLSEDDRLALRNARERSSSDINQRPEAVELLGSVMVDLRGLQREVEQLRLDVNRLLEEP